MELVNFTLNKDLIALEVDGKYLDLHNNYDFQGFIQDSSAIKIKWAIAKGDWVPSNIPSQLTLKIEDISYFEQRGDLSGVKDIEELGFYENSSLGKVVYNGSNKPQDGSSLLLLRFVGGSEIAVIGKQASCFI